VKAGEAGGILDEILNRLANYLESSEQLRQKVKGALTYPVVVMLIAVAVVVFLITFVLPSFEAIFKDMGDAKLPAPTRMLLALSAFMNQYFILIIIAVAAGVVALKNFSRRRRARASRHEHAQDPGHGTMLKKVAVAKFTRTLGTPIASGNSILQARSR
jgi:type IV pilus assembly protein PilC